MSIVKYRNQIKAINVNFKTIYAMLVLLQKHFIHYTFLNENKN